MTREHEDMVRKLIFAVTAGVLALTATACNTVRGAGNDTAVA